MSKPTEAHIDVLSFGAGVQSSALLFAYLNGLLKPMPSLAVFADTQAEPRYVYDWLTKLRGVAGDKIPIVIRSRGNIVEDLLQTEKRSAAIPFFIKNDDGTQGMGRRQCTREYKVEIITKTVREYLGYQPRQRVKHQVNMVIGISTDEAERMRDNRTPWIKNKYPLIEDLGWDRQDCIEYVREQKLGSPPKSACFICPYRNNDSWKNLKRQEPEAFQRAVEFEADMQAKDRSKPGEYRGTPYLHRSCQPLGTINFDELSPDSPLFANDCEGMCGV